MDNAGFDVDSSQDRRQGRRQQGRNSTDSIADQRDEIEELKSQNEQIIELLKRISDSLNNGNGRNTGGRRSGRR